MKRSIIAAAVLSSFFIGASAFAADDSGVLEITGRVVGTTCQFIDGNQSEINLNDIGEDKLQGLQPGAIFTGVTQSTAVPLKIQCKPGVTPHISFSTTQFDGKDITVNNGSATGVGFAVYYGDANGLPIKPQDGVVLTPSTDGIYNLNFAARYARAETGEVSAGDVKSTLTLTVVTE